MGSTEAELKAILLDLGVMPYFLGTFDKHFPGFIHAHKKSCAIVNTATRETGGVHWLAFAWLPKKNIFYMFDPFGFSDAKLKQVYHFEYTCLLKKSALASTPNHCVILQTSQEAIQGPNSAACGLFCCLFLYSFVHYPEQAFDNPIMDLVQGVPNKFLLSPHSQSILKKNQDNLYRFLRSKSVYFRTHQQKLESNTHFNKVNA